MFEHNIKKRNETTIKQKEKMNMSIWCLLLVTVWCTHEHELLICNLGNK